jgi:hypothetical protein
MSFRADQLRGAHGAAGAGVVDHRLARQFLISEYRKGRIAREQVCDAHPELVRAARELGEPSGRACPICGDHDVVLVTYVFGPRLPAFGRCISAKGELAKLNRRTEQLTAYVVEVCPGCSWNHLLRVLPLGGQARSRAR